MTTGAGLLRAPVALALSLAAAVAWAGRPLATDDAGTAPRGSCQLEAWLDRASEARELVAAPACGVADGLELGVDATRRSPASEGRVGAGMAAKWVPGAAQGLATPAGALHLGLKASAASDRGPDGDWSSPTVALAALASLEAGAAWTVHANVGGLRDRARRESGTFVNAALAWKPHERWLAFVEAQANDRRPVFGPAVRSAGLRHWLVADVLGLDLVASREAGVAGTRWSVGFGWYGIGAGR